MQWALSGLTPASRTHMFPYVPSVGVSVKATCISLAGCRECFDSNAVPACRLSPSIHPGFDLLQCIASGPDPTRLVRSKQGVAVTPVTWYPAIICNRVWHFS